MFKGFLVLVFFIFTLYVIGDIITTKIRSYAPEPMGTLLLFLWIVLGIYALILPFMKEVKVERDVDDINS